MTPAPLINGDGTPEPVWRDWLAAQHFAPLLLASLVPMGSRLVVVAPHPDDEILACGALLADCVRNSIEVLVIALTDGDASHGTHDQLAMRRLAERRRAESANGLGVLGLLTRHVIRLRLPDGQLRQHQGQITAALLHLLNAFDVVVTTWALDGHPDHEAAGEAAVAACHARGCTVLQAPVWMWHWAQPGDARVPWAHMVALGASPEASALKQQALACHNSQLISAVYGQTPILGAAMCARAMRPAEYFFKGAPLYEA